MRKCACKYHTMFVIVLDYTVVYVLVCVHACQDIPLFSRANHDQHPFAIAAVFNEVGVYIFISACIMIRSVMVGNFIKRHAVLKQMCPIPIVCTIYYKHMIGAQPVYYPLQSCSIFSFYFPVIHLESILEKKNLLIKMTRRELHNT